MKTKQNTMAESSKIFSYNKFSILYIEENTVDEDCDGSFDDIQATFNLRGKKNMSKRPKKKIVKKRIKHPTKNTETNEGSFGCKEPTETLRCKDCNNKTNEGKK
jgi:hypothetical protein